MGRPQLFGTACGDNCGQFQPPFWYTYLELPLLQALVASISLIFKFNTQTKQKTEFFFQERILQFHGWKWLKESLSNFWACCKGLKSRLARIFCSFRHLGKYVSIWDESSGVLTFDAKKSFYSRSAAISNYSWIASGSKTPKDAHKPFPLFTTFIQKPFQTWFPKKIFLKVRF